MDSDFSAKGYIGNYALKKGFTVKGVAKESGVSPSTVRCLFRGGYVSRAKCDIICNYLGLDLSLVCITRSGNTKSRDSEPSKPPFTATSFSEYESFNLNDLCSEFGADFNYMAKGFSQKDIVLERTKFSDTADDSFEMYKNNGNVLVADFFRLLSAYHKGSHGTWFQCEDCNGIFSKNGGMPKFCGECSKKRTKAGNLKSERKRKTKEAVCKGCGKIFLSQWAYDSKKGYYKWKTCCSKRCSSRFLRNKRIMEVEHVITDAAIMIHNGSSLTEASDYMNVSRTKIKIYLEAYHMPYSFLCKNPRRVVMENKYKGGYKDEAMFVDKIVEQILPFMDSVEREVQYGGQSRCDIVAKYGMFRYAIECKNETTTTAVSTCIGQAICAGYDLGAFPVCCFPETSTDIEFQRKACHSKGVMFCTEKELLKSLGVSGV